MIKKTISISGMTCGHCVKMVESIIKGYPEIQESSVSIGKAEIEYEDSFNIKELFKTLSDAGYDAKE